jgi:lipopolysaccharide transport system permease protein
MLTKVSFPREALLISGVLKLLFGFSVRVVMLAIFIAIYKVPLAWSMLLTPIPIALLIMMGMAVGLTVMPLSWLLDDLNRIVAALMSFAFFITPIVYPPQQGKILGTLSNINPVTPLLVTGKELMTGSSLTYPREFVAVSIGTTIVFFFGLVLTISQPILNERMSADGRRVTREVEGVSRVQPGLEVSLLYGGVIWAANCWAALSSPRCARASSGLCRTSPFNCGAKMRWASLG